jgi:hypothetical protein
VNKPSTAVRSPRALQQALILALLVGGTGAFLAEQPPHAGDADRVSEASDTTPDTVADEVPTQTQQLSQSAVMPIAPAATPLLRELLAPQHSNPPATVKAAHRARHARPHRRSMDPLGADAASAWGDGFAPRGRHRGRSEEDIHVTGAMDWLALARCESGGNPHVTDPSGHYGGLYQFDAHTWHSLGGHGLPQDASPSEQTTRARALYRERGLSPWPSCGRRAER